MEGFFYNGIWRMDWGLGNPNTTAALITTLMVGVWAFSWLRKWGFWVAVILFTGMGICLIHTFSRGGLIALFAGMIPLVIMAPRPWPWFRIITITIAVWIMIGFSIYLNAHQRYGQGVIKEDRSITNRLKLWKSGPPMIVEAPSGWGFGKAANSYTQWYQPLDRQERYRNFVNSHFDMLIELGWPLRFLYVFGWLGIFLLCWPVARFRWFAVPLGIWLAFAVAAIFSSVAVSPWLWILPGMALLAVIVCRWHFQCWPRAVLWSIPTATALMVLSMLFLSGQRAGKIYGSSDLVLIGGTKPTVWLVADPKVLGQEYGRTLRKYLQSHETEILGIVESVENLPDASGATVIFTGTLDEEGKARLASLSGNAAELILVAPSFLPHELELSIHSNRKIKVIVGELAQSASLQAWKDVAEIQIVEGVGAFFQNWPEIFFDKQHQ